MTLPICPETTNLMGRSFVIHPSVGKASTLVGEGDFGRWCLGMVMILVVGNEDIGRSVNHEAMEKKFVGLSLNQGSKQWEYLVSRNVPERRNET